MVKWSTLARRGRGVVGPLALVIAAAVAAPAVAQAHDAFEDPARGILPPGDWSPQQVEVARSLVRRAEEVLPAKFGDLAKVQAMGYTNFGLTSPGGYDHWGLPNRPGQPDDGHVLDPEHPESLVFQRQPDGRQVLVAAMFVLAPDATMADIPPEYAWLPGWHTHTGQFCIDENSRAVGVPTNGHCTTGHELTSPMMHVWITDNACGHRFAGIDVDGVVCGDHHQPVDRGTGGTVLRPGSRFPGGTVPAPAVETPSTGGSDGHTGEPDPGGVTPTAPPARAVSATPSYTG